MASMDTIELYVTDSHRVVFAANGGFPVYSATPENVYRLILSENEEDIILQGRSDRRIVPAEAEGNWVPKSKGGCLNGQVDRDLVASLGISRWWESSSKVHRSKEKGWEEVARWSSEDHEFVLAAAKDVIAADQATLKKAENVETKRQEKIRRIVDSLTAESSIA